MKNNLCSPEKPHCLKVSGFTKHGLNKAIGSHGRNGVKPRAILDALYNPLKVKDVVTDKYGRQSQRYVGREGEVVVNPKPKNDYLCKSDLFFKSGKIMETIRKINMETKIGKPELAYLLAHLSYERPDLAAQIEGFTPGQRASITLDDEIADEIKEQFNPL